MELKEAYNSVNYITSSLIKCGLSEDQNFPVILKKHKEHDISFPGHSDMSIALKNISYSEIYEELIKSRQYNIKLLDGGLIQMLYRFTRSGLLKHRLCYFPSPTFESFQNEPDTYIDQSNYYADMVERAILPVPVRFDYDPKNAEEIYHPTSHLTLGQYKNCRIAVSAPLCPSTFINFILHSFYNTAAITIPFDFQTIKLKVSIKDSEKRLLHLSIN